MLPPILRYRTRVHKIQVEAVHWVLNNVDPEAQEIDTVLSSGINSFDDRVKDQYPDEGKDYGEWSNGVDPQ